MRRRLTIGPIPDYGHEQTDEKVPIDFTLGSAGWAPYSERSKGTTHLFAARSLFAGDVDARALHARLNFPPDLLAPTERLEVGTADEESPFAGRTYVSYTGCDELYLDYIVDQLVAFGEEVANSENQHRLRRLEAIGTASGLAALGVAYTLLHRK
jgi:hypothetical protein